MPNNKNRNKKSLTKHVTELNPTPRDKKLKRGVVNVETGSTDHLPPRFSFDFADDNRFSLWETSSEYLKMLMKTLKIMGSQTWGQLRKHHGLGMKVIETKHQLPQDVSPDIEIIEVRISQQGRLHGFRVDDVFQVLWFDPNHLVCPENKVRR